MLHKIKEYLQSNNLLLKGDRIVAGVSGGADSICLFYLLVLLRREYGLFLSVVHINHGIRGKEADRDEQFVKEICRRYGVPLKSLFCDVKKLALRERISEEEAGRNIRYQAFLEYCKENKCNKLAIAHNKNDNAETVLFHLFRGSGIRGLSGMDPAREVNTGFGKVTIIRPLLCVTRNEIEEFLRTEAICYQIDSTNLTDDYSRNKIRNRILTYARDEINAQAVSNIAEAADVLKEIESYLNDNIRVTYEKLVEEENGTFRLGAAALLQEPIVIRKGLIKLLLEKLAGKSKDLEAVHVVSVLKLAAGQVGKQLHLPYNMIAQREYNDIILYQKQIFAAEQETLPAFVPTAVKVPGTTLLTGRNIVVVTELLPCKKKRIHSEKQLCEMV